MLSSLPAKAVAILQAENVTIQIPAMDLDCVWTTTSPMEHPAATQVTNACMVTHVPLDPALLEVPSPQLPSAELLAEFVISKITVMAWEAALIW
jgi:hypothetical protein